jgi:prepilin-type N-terminal cleavage/methylation domain-containing protein
MSRKAAKATLVISAIGNRRSAEAGFTLIELAVVLAVVVLMASILPVALERVMPSRRVSATAQRIVSVIREAQADSLASGRPMRVELASLAFPQSIHVELLDPEGQALRELVTYPDGSLPAARFNIIERNHRAAVVISGITGRIRLERDGHER